MRSLRRLILALSVTAGLVGVLAGPASAASQGRTTVATVNGGGTAEMVAPLAVGTTHWGAGITLYSDHTASGSFDCLDQNGDAPGFAGNVWGQATDWFIDENGYLSLVVVGKFIAIGVPTYAADGHPQDMTFIVRIRQFGGAGVGFWTLESGGFIFCYDLLTSGQIVIRYA
jgi:hypothetical protein